MNKINYIVSILVFSFLTGCAYQRDLEATIDDDLNSVSIVPIGPQSIIEMVDAAYIGEATLIRPVMPRNAALDQDLVAIRFTSAVSPRIILGLLQDRVRIPVDVTSDAQAVMSDYSDTAGTKGIMLDYSGSVSMRRVLDDMTGRMGLSWRLSADATKVEIFHLETRVFHLASVMSPIDVKGRVSKQSTGRSGSQVDNAVSLAGDSFKDVDTALRAMISDKGKVSLTPSTGLVVVTDRPLVLAAVESYLNALNGLLKKTIVMDVKVHQVSVDDRRGGGIRWDTVWENLSSRYRVNALSGPVNAELGASSIGFAVIDESFNYGGSQALVSSLAKQGKVSELRKATVVALNRRPATLNLTEDRVYLAESRSTLVPNVGIVQDAEAGVVSTGFALTLVPQIIPSLDGTVNSESEVMLSAIVDISSLNSLRVIDGGTTRIEAPETSTQQSIPTVALRSGQTVIFAGLDSSRLQHDRDGVLTPRFFGLGGGRTASDSRSTIVMSVTLFVR